MTLFVFSGLPGVGKTTVARALARLTGAIHLRIDSIEQPLLDAGWRVDGKGYEIARAIAEDNLRVGLSVIADCVNPWPVTRQDWQAVGDRTGARVVNVEVVCSDVDEHRRRVEARVPVLPAERVPAWTEVLARDYVPWDRPRIAVDTSRLDGEACARRILEEAPSARSVPGKS